LRLFSLTAFEIFDGVQAMKTELLIILLKAMITIEYLPLYIKLLKVRIAKKVQDT
jgi:hypothetical protein